MKKALISYPFEHSNYWEKKKQHIYNDIKFPRIVLNNEGKKLLIVETIVPTSSFEEGIMHPPEISDIFTNLCHYLQDKEFNIKELSIINYKTFRPNKNISDKQLVKLNKQWFKRIYDFAIKYKACAVIFLGEYGFEHIYKPPFNLELNIVHYYKNLPFILTDSTVNFGKQDSEAGKGFANLIGIVIEAIRLGINEKPLFDINNNVEKCRKNLITNKKDFDKFYKKLKKSKKIAIDTEIKTNGVLRKNRGGGVVINRINNKLLTIQFCLDGDDAYTIPFYHPQTPFSTKELSYVCEKMKNYFEYGDSEYHIFHNAKFDIIQIMAQLKLEYYKADVYDTMTGEYMLDENKKHLSDKAHLGKYNVYSLEYLEHKYGYRRKEMVVSKDQRNNLAEIDLEYVSEYGIIDAVTTYHIHACQIQYAKIIGEYTKEEFLNTALHSFGYMILAFAYMEVVGVYMDPKHLLNMTAKSSEVYKIIEDINLKFKNSKNARTANKILLKESGIPVISKDLFGKKELPWIFNIRRPRHKQVLFFDVMELEPVNIGKTGFKVDKKFQMVHSNVEEVALLSEYSKASKIRDTYITGLWKIITQDNDFKLDQCLRSSYDFVRVLTGRASASNPGFQQIPSRGPLSKYIKRIFIPPLGYLCMEADYSAHEVRDWGNTANDINICNTFRKGLEARRKMRIKGSSNKKILRKLRAFVEDVGDVHKLNYRFFFKRDPKNKEERNGVKEVVFGVIYGKTANSLAESLKIASEKAQELIDLLFKVFPKGGNWIKSKHKEGRAFLYVKSKLGVIRHLYGYLHNKYNVHNAMDRRAVNSPIQGCASLMNFIASRLMQKLIWDLFISQGQPFTLKQEMSVHDSNKGICSIVEAPIAAYIQEHAMTTELHRFLKDKFNIKTLVDYEIEFEIGGSQATCMKWDFLYDTTEKDNKHLVKPDDFGIGFKKIIKETIKWMESELNYEIDKKKVLKAVKHNYKIVSKLRNKELKKASKNHKSADMTRLLTRENSLKQGFIFHNDFIKKYPNAFKLKG